MLSPYPFGLSPWPVATFVATLVIVCFRGFPEFGGLAARSCNNSLQLDDFIIDLQDEITVNQMEAITLFFL